MAPRPKVGIIYLSYHPEQYLPRVVASWQRLSYPRDRLVIAVVDNPHPVHGSSGTLLQEHLLPLAQRGELPPVAILPQEKNLGFSGGNNVGIRWALDQGCDYIFLHNQDGFLEADALEKLVTAMEEDPGIGAAQALILFDDGSGRVNSAGNNMHYLGLGFCDAFRAPHETVGPAVREVNYASGAAVLLRAPLLRAHGLWDEDFFFYHEDLEYSLRLKSRGYKIVLVPQAIFYHHYEFARNLSKIYYMERNRYGVLLMFYKWPTLLLLLPMAILLEAGLIIFSIYQGWLGEKLRVYGYWLQLAHIRLWWRKRQLIQRARLVPDRLLLAAVAGRVIFEDEHVDSWLLRHVGNPISASYWRVVKRLIFW